MVENQQSSARKLQTKSSQLVFLFSSHQVTAAINRASDATLIEEDKTIETSQLIMDQIDQQVSSFNYKMNCDCKQKYHKGYEYVIIACSVSLTN